MVGGVVGMVSMEMFGGDEGVELCDLSRNLAGFAWRQVHGCSVDDSRTGTTLLPPPFGGLAITVPALRSRSSAQGFSAATRGSSASNSPIWHKGGICARPLSLSHLHGGGAPPPHHTSLTSIHHNLRTPAASNVGPTYFLSHC